MDNKENGRGLLPRSISCASNARVPCSFYVRTTLFISKQNESGRKITSSASFYAELSGASVFLPGRSDHIRGSDRSGSVCL